MCAFWGCTALAQISIPDGVTEISGSAFEGCTSLAQITIPDSVTVIGECAFNDCKSLTQINIPDGVTEIGYCAFKGCKHLADDNGFVVVRNGLYGYLGSDTHAHIPDGVTEIGESAFKYCESLTQISIPDSVTVIGENAFEYCKSLTQINIPDGVTEIGSCAFWGCTALAQINLPNGVTEICFETFKWCQSLKQIHIPDSVTEIKRGAFENCTALTQINIHENKIKIDATAFKGCTKLKILSASGAFRWKCSLPHTITSYIGCKNEVDCAYMEIFQSGKNWEDYLGKLRFDREKVLEEIVKILRNEKKISAAQIKKVQKYIEKYAFEISDSAKKEALESLSGKKPAATAKMTASAKECHIKSVDFSEVLQTKHKYGWIEVGSVGNNKETKFVSKTDKMTGFTNAVFRGFKSDIDKVCAFAKAEGVTLSAQETDIDDIFDVFVNSELFWNDNKDFIDKVIYKFPEIKVIAFFERWEGYDVYVCLSSPGKSYIDQKMRIGIVDSNRDLRYTEERFPTERFSVTAGLHNCDYRERMTYRFPYEKRWNAFDYTHVENNKLYDIFSIDAAEGTETLDGYDFGRSEHLKRISLPSTLKTLNAKVFDKKPAVEISIHPDNPYLSIEDGFLVEKQGGKVLYVLKGADLSGLASPSMKTIAPNAFCNVAPESVIIPANITSICDYAFEKQTGLRTVTFEGTILPKMSSLAFAECERIDTIIFLNASMEGLQLVGFEKPVITGFLRMVTSGKYALTEEVLQGGNAYIKKHNSVVVSNYADNLNYISYCFENKLISAQYANQLIKPSNTNTELRAMVLNYTATLEQKDTSDEYSFENTEEQQAPISLLGLKFVVTGNLKRYPDRADFKTYIESRGGKLISAISSKIDYLVTNTPNSGTVKNAKARSLGIPVITEDEFFEKFGE